MRRISCSVVSVLFKRSPTLSKVSRWPSSAGRCGHEGLRRFPSRRSQNPLQGPRLRFATVVKLVTARHVIDLVARMHGCTYAMHGCTYAEMRGPSRQYSIVATRDAAMCAVMVLKASLPRGQIGCCSIVIRRRCNMRSGSGDALTDPRVQALCDELGIKIVDRHRYPEPGEARAVETLARIIRRHGEGHLRLVLSTLAETDNNEGQLDEVLFWATSDMVRACP